MTTQRSSNGLKHALESDDDDDDQVVVLMVPFLVHSHVNMLLNLGHSLASSYPNISFHFAGCADHYRKIKLRYLSHQTSTGSQTLPLIHFHDISPDLHDPTFNPLLNFAGICTAISNMRQPVSQLLQQLATKYGKVVAIYDYVMSSAVQDVKLLPNAQAYSFYFSSALSVFYECWDAIGEVKPFELDPETDQLLLRNPISELCPYPKITDFAVKQLRLSEEFESGKLYNTSRVIEGKFVELLERMRSNTKHVAVGPTNMLEISWNVEGQQHRCIKWLDQQEKDSVIYVAFGTVSDMTPKQVQELAIGLEKSGQKFIWAIKRNQDPDDEDVLPQGFAERVSKENRGIVERDWAPQVQILAHPSIGGFMSHCGTGSCMESISFGVPVAAWPMHSDHPKHAILLTEVLKIGVPVRQWANRAELVKSTMVETAVRRLMASEQGQEMRGRARELGNAVRDSFAPGGSSRSEIDSFIAHITHD